MIANATIIWSIMELQDVFTARVDDIGGRDRGSSLPSLFPLSPFALALQVGL